MTRKLTGFLALALVLVAGVAAAGVLYAQKSGGMGGMMGMMSMMQDCPMMQAMHESPAAVLRQREALDLSAEQVQRLEALQARAEQAGPGMMQQMQAIHREIRSATGGDRFDEAAVRAAYGRMAALHTEMGVSMSRMRHEVRQVLTPAQRGMLQENAGGMAGMHGMMQGGMMGGMDMENCPMMRGMMQHGEGASPERQPQR